MYTVLIADDEVNVLRGLSLLLDWEKYGFRVEGYAADGEEALCQLRRDAYDLVISDIRMPGVDGLALLRQKERLGIPTKVILLSAYADFDYAQQAIRHGAIAYLLKPVSETLLIDALDRARGMLEDAGAGRSAPEKRRQSSDLVKEVVMRVNEDFSGEVCVQALADDFYVTPDHLSRLFRKKMGVGLNEYISAARIEKAKRLLRNERMMIYEISERVGFKDVDYFCRVFKSAVGVTPSAYRSHCANRPSPADMEKISV